MELLSLIAKVAGVVVQALAVYVAYRALNKEVTRPWAKERGLLLVNRGRLLAAATRRWGVQPCRRYYFYPKDTNGISWKNRCRSYKRSLNGK
ncbi:hypothetical protein [Salinithrix halophila]|uniref:Uncharacterized protein n=1 Tax=Salinithrix halophila TaxID=1485204 RepID=A0ABV8JC65_9BACL